MSDFLHILFLMDPYVSIFGKYWLIMVSILYMLPVTLYELINNYL